MNPDTRAKIEKAISALDLVDVVLFDGHFSRYSDFPETVGASYRQLWKRGVFCRRDDDAASGKEFLVKAELGVRLCDPNTPESDDPECYASIEAAFVAMYTLKEDIDFECLKAFAEINGIHNIWPFWRQFVFDTVQKAKLPHISVPLMAGVPKKST